jgi:hypothetical protein
MKVARLHQRAAMCGFVCLVAFVLEAARHSTLIVASATLFKLACETYTAGNTLPRWVQTVQTVLCASARGFLNLIESYQKSQMCMAISEGS